MEQEEQQLRGPRRGRNIHRRYVHFILAPLLFPFQNSNFAPSLPGISIPFSFFASGSAESQNAAAENKDREVIIAMVTKAVTAITQRLTSLSTFDGTDSKVRTSTHVGGRFATLVLARGGPSALRDSD